jgi:putative MATE family efflux protein
MMTEIAINKTSMQSSTLTDGPITGALLAFALPTLASNVLQAVNSSIDAIWVGRLLGKTALAATSNANLFMFLIFSLIIGSGIAATIMIGQHMGRRDLVGVRRTIGAGVGFFLLIGCCVAIFMWFAMPTLLHFLGTPADVQRQALNYSRVLFFSLPSGLLFVFLQMALRGTGDSVTPLLFIIANALINASLNPVLILGLGQVPELGISGSAVATLIANSASLSLLLIYVYARNLPIRLRSAELRYLLPNRDVVLTIVRKGIPMGLQMIVMASASLLMMVLVNREGSSTVAAYAIVNQLWAYIQMPALAIGMAVSTMTAQNIGAGRWDRVDRIASSGVSINMLIGMVLVLIAMLADRVVLKLFLHDDVAVIDIAHHINSIAGWGFVLFGVTTVLTAVPRANGAVVAPLIVMTIAVIPGQFGAVYLLKTIVGADALWWSFPVGSIIAMLLTFCYYRYGTWRKLKLLITPREAIA